MKGVIAGDLRCALSGFSLGVSGSLVAACSLVLLAANPKNSKKGFFVKQYSYAEFAEVHLSHRSQTNDRFIVRMKSPLASAAQIYLLRRKKRLFESCPCRNIYETRCPRSGETHPVLVKEID